MTALNFTPSDFDRVRRQAEELYRQIGQVRCPYLEGDVHFNTEGFRHLLFKGWNRGRSRADQYVRLKHLVKAPEILRLSRTLQGREESVEWERRRRHGRWERDMLRVTYYEFVAVLADRRFKVIVKQLPDGQRVFWSLIPFWRRTQEGRRLLHDGHAGVD